jgi:hypothetical protein
MKNLDIIAEALGWEIRAYRGFYDLDKKDGTRSIYCETLADVTSQLARIIKKGGFNA